MGAPWWMPLSNASRVQAIKNTSASITPAKKQHTLKTQLVTDGEHHILAISEAIPGNMHDKKLSDQLQTLERLPDGCEVKADSGYQGLAKQAGSSSHSEPPTAEVQTAERPPDEPQTASRVSVTTPYKKTERGRVDRRAESLQSRTEPGARAY